MFLSGPNSASYILIPNSFISICSDFVLLSEHISIIGMSSPLIFEASSLILSNFSNINLSI